MKTVSAVLTLAVSLMLVGNLLAADEKKPREHRGGPGRGMMMPGPFDVLKGLNLTDEQKAKVDELKKSVEPKLKDAMKKYNGSLTDDQKKAREEAMKAAREAKKRPSMKDIEAAMKLTDEQKANKAEIEAVMKDAREKIMAILTPEQKDQLKKKMEGRRGDRKPKDKPADKPEEK